MPISTVSGELKKFTPEGVEIPDPKVITADVLSPQKPIELPKPPEDTNNYTGILASGKSLISSAKIVQPESDWFEKYLSTSQAPQDLSGQYNEAYGSSGYEMAAQDKIAKQATVKSAQNEMNLLTSELQGIQDSATAQSLALEGQAQRTGTTAPTMTFLNRQQTEINRQAAIAALPTQARILAAQAKVTAAQGDLETSNQTLALAQQKMDTLFKLKSDYNTQLYNYNKDLRDKIYDYATTKEQQQIDAMQKEDDRKYQQEKDNSSYLQELAKMALGNGQSNLIPEIMGIDPTSEDFAQQLGAAQAKIQVKPELNTEVVKLDNGATVLLNTDTGEVIKNLGGVAPTTISGGTSSITSVGSDKADVSTMSPEAQAVLNGTLRLEDLTPSTKGKIAGELMAAGYSSQPKLSSAQQEDLSTMETVNKMLDQVLDFNADGKLEGIGSFGRGSLYSLAGQLGFSSEEAMSVRALIGNIKGTVAKLRGGTSFTTNEEKLLDSYVPSINDNPSVAINKINLLKQFIENKRTTLYEFSQDRNLPSSTLEGDALRSKYNY